MNTATLKCWSVTSNQNGFLAPELVGYQLQGNVYGDSSHRFEDGQFIKTSTIRGVGDYGVHKVVETINTEYFVYPDDVDPDYEKQYPDAYKKLSMRGAPS